MVIITIGYVLGMVNGYMDGSSFNDNCYEYTNISGRGAGSYFNGKCYLPNYDSYETREVCRGGFIGIGQSCYESSETHYESYRLRDKCIVAKTGERC